MKTKKIVIVGMGPAAAGASTAIQFTNPNAEIHIVQKMNYEMYSPCGMPFALEGKLSLDELKHAFPSKNKKTSLYLGTEAKGINIENKELLVFNNEKGDYKIEYDSLIIATGTKPFIPPVKGIKKALSKGYALTVNSLEEFYYLSERIKTKQKATIVGAGAIGIEVAIALKEKGLDVLIAEMMPQVFPNALDKDMARQVQKYLEKKGIEILTEAKLEAIIEEKNRTIINGEEKQTDLIILACGTEPNIGWLKDSGIEYNKNGIITDKRMSTNIKNIYAAGDCVETYNLITGKKQRSILAVPARKQGRISGLNACGKRTSYSGTMNTFISVFNNYAIGSTGLTANQAKEEGHELIQHKVTATNKPEWFPQTEDLTIKLIANKKGKLLGCQAWGEKNAVKSRIDTIASYLSRKSSLTQMIHGELAYCPAVSLVPDPLTIAIEAMIRRIKK